MAEGRTTLTGQQLCRPEKGWPSQELDTRPHPSRPLAPADRIGGQELAPAPFSSLQLPAPQCTACSEQVLKFSSLFSFLPPPPPLAHLLLTLERP